jgi:hypothetical protein
MFWAMVGTVNIPAIATINAVAKAVTNDHQPFFQKDAANNFISNRIELRLLNQLNSKLGQNRAIALSELKEGLYFLMLGARENT